MYFPIRNANNYYHYQFVPKLKKPAEIVQSYSILSNFKSIWTFELGSLKIMRSWFKIEM